MASLVPVLQGVDEARVDVGLLLGFYDIPLPENRGEVLVVHHQSACRSRAGEVGRLDACTDVPHDHVVLGLWPLGTVGLAVSASRVLARRLGLLPPVP